MCGRIFWSKVGHAFDPKRDIEKDLPRPFLLIKYFIEYLFRLVGFFVLFLICFGAILSSCTNVGGFQSFPPLLILLFFVYVSLTSIGTPFFLLIGEIKNPWLRRPLGYIAAFIVFVFASTMYNELPLVGVTRAYIERIFPEAKSCEHLPYRLQ